MTLTGSDRRGTKLAVTDRRATRLAVGDRLAPLLVTLGGALLLPALQLAGAITPAVELDAGPARAFDLPSVQLSGEFAPVVELSGAMALPQLQLAGSFSPVVDLGGTVALPLLQLAGSFAPVVSFGASTLPLPPLQLAGTFSPVVDLGGAMALPQLQLAGSFAPVVELGGAMALPQLQLAGSFAPAVSMDASTLTLPSLQLSGSFTVSASKVSAWLRVAGGTVTGSGYSSIPDVLASNPAVQSVDARRPAAATSANGLPILSFNGTNVLSWPLAAGNSQTAVTGWCGWFKFTSVATAVQRLFCIFNSVGGCTVRRLIFQTLTNTATNTIFVVDGTGNRTGLAPVLTAGVWVWLRFMYVHAGATDADKILVYVNGAPQALTFTGSGTLAGLQATAGNILLGNLSNDGTFASPFTGNMGPNLFNLSTQLTASEETAMKNFEAPT